VQKSLNVSVNTLLISQQMSKSTFQECIVSCIHIIWLKGQNFMCLVCYVMIGPRISLGSNYNGAGRRGYSCGVMCGEQDYCLTSEPGRHFLIPGYISINISPWKQMHLTEVLYVEMSALYSQSTYPDNG
jgi:hypothetical protein